MSLSVKQSTFTFHAVTSIEIRIHETCLLEGWYNTHRHTYPNGVPSCVSQDQAPDQCDTNVPNRTVDRCTMHKQMN